jgi:hypothetical protein
VGAPLTDPSNEAFAKVIAGWNAISKRIYIWNYVVDFGDLVMSFPNYYVRHIVPSLNYVQPCTFIVRV